MNIGFGLGAFALLTVLLNLLGIQLHWLVFLAISLVVPLFALYRQVSVHGVKPNFADLIKLNKSTMYALAVLLVFFVFFGVYLKGAFAYPYLEDDDPWFHAEAAKFIAEERTYSHDPSLSLSYIEPYPPAYAVLMGTLYQTNTDVIWTLKFFNVLLISLGLIFFYFFAKVFFDSAKKAFLSAFVLAVIPCFMSHFIWASTLSITLFFPAFYAAERIKDDSRWWIVLAICTAGILVSQPSNSLIFGVLLVSFWLLKAVTTRSFQKWLFLAGLAGILLALIFFVPNVVKYGSEGIAGGLGFSASNLLHFSSAESGGGLLYAWNDFIFAQEVSKMDNPVGVGVVLFFLATFSLVFLLYLVFHKPKQILSKGNFSYLFVLFWLLFAFAGIHGNRLPVQLMPHRFWAIFAIPVALIAAEGFFALGKLSERLRIHRFFIYAALIAGILITSGYPKYVVETSYWPPGVNWGSQGELLGYLQYVKPLPYNTKVFPICSPDFKALAFDKMAEPWDPNYVSFKEHAFNSSVSNVVSWLKARNYEFMVLDSYCVGKFGVNETNDKLQELASSSEVQIVAQGDGFVMFKL